VTIQEPSLSESEWPVDDDLRASWSDAYVMTFGDESRQAPPNTARFTVEEYEDELADPDEPLDDHPAFRHVGALLWRVINAQGNPASSADGVSRLGAIGDRYFWKDVDRDIPWEPLGEFWSEDEAWVELLETSGVLAVSVEVSLDGTSWGPAGDLVGLGQQL
jgi:hypothetical protein